MLYIHNIVSFTRSILVVYVYIPLQICAGQTSRFQGYLSRGGRPGGTVTIIIMIV